MRTFLRKDGYADKPPSPQVIQKQRDQQKNAAKKTAAAQQKNACPFRAVDDNGVTNHGVSFDDEL